MKKFSIFFGIMLIVLALGYISAYVFINAKGKNIIVETLEKSLKTQVALDSFSFRFPFNAKISNLGFGDLSFKKINIYNISFNLFSNRITLGKVNIDGFKVKVTKGKDKIQLAPFLSKKLPVYKQSKLTYQQAGFLPINFEDEEGKVPFVIKRLYLKNSTVEFVYLDEGKLKSVLLEDITLNLKNFSYPKLSRFYIKLQSSLFSTADNVKIEDTLSADGWIDYFNKNMDLDINIENFDYLAFSEHYPDFWKPDNLGLKEAILSFKSKLKSKDNDLIIDCDLFLDKVTFREFPKEEDAGESSKVRTLKTVIGLLKGSKDKASLHFRIKTKMDSPEVSVASIKNSVVKEVIKISPVSVIGGFIDKVRSDIKDDVKEMSGKTVDAVVDTIKDAVDTLKGIFGQ